MMVTATLDETTENAMSSRIPNGSRSALENIYETFPISPLNLVHKFDARFHPGRPVLDALHFAGNACNLDFVAQCQQIHKRLTLCGVKRDGGTLYTPTKFVPHSYLCHSRLCANCSKWIAKQDRERVIYALDKGLASGNPIFYLTFTLAHTVKDRLDDLIPVLRDASQKMRSRKGTDAKPGFKRLFLNHLQKFEISAYDEKAGWNPHYHFIVELDPAFAHLSVRDIRKLLETAWRDATAKFGRPSWNVSARELKCKEDAENLPNYLAKLDPLSQKGEEAQGGRSHTPMDKGRIREYALATKGLRVFNTSRAWTVKKDKPNAIKGLDQECEQPEQNGVFWPQRSIDAHFYAASQNLIEQRAADIFKVIAPAILDGFQRQLSNLVLTYEQREEFETYVEQLNTQWLEFLLRYSEAGGIVRKNAILGYTYIREPCEPPPTIENYDPKRLLCRLHCKAHGIKVYEHEAEKVLVA